MRACYDKTKHTALLNGVPLDVIEHYGRPLRQHLIGTYDLLARWGNPEYLCLAGLFHSVYGTRTFQSAALTTASRNMVRDRIGPDAESLVYAFCMSDRKRLLLESRSAPYFWIDHRNGSRTEISERFLGDLVEMEVANFVEQLPFRTDKPDAAVEDMWHRFESSTSRMSISARDAFRVAINWRIGEEKAPARTVG